MTDADFVIEGHWLWFAASSLLMFASIWTWMLVRQFGGIRPTALAIIATSAAINTAAHGWGGCDSCGANVVARALITATWAPMVICILVMIDIYAADRNGHRSFTAISYNWYRKLVDRDRAPGDARSPYHLGDHHAR